MFSPGITQQSWVHWGHDGITQPQNYTKALNSCLEASLLQHNIKIWMIFQTIIYHITHSNSSISTSWSPFPIFPFLILAKFFLSNAKSPAKSSSISRLWLSVKLLLLQLRCVRLWHLRAPPASWGCEPAWAGPGSAPWAPPSAASSPRTAASPGVVVAALPHCSCVNIQDCWPARWWWWWAPSRWRCRLCTSACRSSCPHLDLAPGPRNLMCGLTEKNTFICVTYRWTYGCHGDEAEVEGV